MKKLILIFMIAISPAFAELSESEEQIIKAVTEALTSSKKEPQYIPPAKFEDKKEDTEDNDGIISISLSDPNDVNWQGVLESSSAGNGPDPVSMPIFHSIQFPNLELKFKLLERKF